MRACGSFEVPITLFSSKKTPICAYGNSCPLIETLERLMWLLRALATEMASSCAAVRVWLPVSIMFSALSGYKSHELSAADVA